MGANVTKPRKVGTRTAGGGGKPDQQSPFPIGPEDPPGKDTLYTSGIENLAAESEGEHPGTGDRNPERELGGGGAGAGWHEIPSLEHVGP